MKGWELAEAALLFVAVYGVALLVGNWVGRRSPSSATSRSPASALRRLDLVLEWGWVVDGLSIMMYFVVGVVGSVVFTYAKGYMKGDVRFTWFFAAFSLFAGAMLVLVSSPNLIQLIVGWELVGLASYLLIGHYWEDHANNVAAIKAFLVNKVADVGLFVGVIIVGVTVGSFRFTDLLAAVAARRLGPGPGGVLGGPGDLHRGDGQERPVPLPRLASRCHGRPHPGVVADARRHHGDRRGVPDGADVPALSDRRVRRRRQGDHDRGRSPHPVPQRVARPGAGRHQEGAGLLHGLANSAT